MMTEERTRFEVLLENIQTSVNVIAEGHIALVERLDRMESRFESRFDGLETRIDRLETRFDVFASDTQQRLQRIEGHLELNGSSSSSPRRKTLKHAPPKRHKTR